MPRRSVSINEDDVQRAEAKAQQQAQARRLAEEAGRFKETWKVPPRYQVSRLLGSGAYGSVCEAKDSQTKRRVAIKQARNLLDDPIDAKRALREVAILSKLDHRHVIQLYDLVVPNDLVHFNEIYIVLEICDSDLKKLCRADVRLTRLHVTTLLYNLLVGLSYVHSAGIWHRDLKPANCLVNEDCTVKICDFGLARAVGSTACVKALDGDDDGQSQKRQLTGHVVTRWYRAPELILLQEDYTEAIDMWSVGCIYAELLGMLEGTSYEDRAPLFPGHTCFPLSPHAKHKTDACYYTKGTRDQMVMICDLIGTPSKEDIAEISSSDARGYMVSFPKRRGDGVRARFGALEQVGAGLLESMLVFSPRRRIKVREALEHPLFSQVRDRKLETSATSQISLDFDDEGGEEELDEGTLRELFLEEVRRFHPELPLAL